jgi:hypothetical protein
MGPFSFDLQKRQAQIDAWLAVMHGKTWFQRTSVDVRNDLIALAADADSNRDCSGFLARLAALPDAFDGLVVDRILRLHAPVHPDGKMYKIVVTYRLRRVEGGTVFEYPLMEYRQGSNCGTKGIVLAQDAGRRISHILTLAGPSIAAGTTIGNCVGGFRERIGDRWETDAECFLREAREELAAPELRFETLLLLGAPVFSPSESSLACSLLCGIVRLDDVRYLLEASVDQLADAIEVTRTRAIPIGDLRRYLLEENRDGVFGNCVVLALAKGLIAL